MLRGAEPLGGLAEIGRQIAGVVDQIDQILPDHALRRAGEGDRELLGEMAAERHFGGDKGFQIVVVVVGGAAAPFGVGGGRGVLRHARGGFGGLFGKDVVERGIQRLLDFGAGAEIAVQPFFLAGLEAVAAEPPDMSRSARRRNRRHSWRIVGIGEFGALGRRFARNRRLGAVIGALQQRIPLQFLLDEGRRSRFDSCSSLIACISCGVITSDCDWRNSSLCVSAMEARTDPMKVGPILAYLSPKPMYTA